MSIRRSTRRYLGQAAEVSHEFQEFLNDNPAVAAGLATIGGIVVNALMQSKYGTTLSGLINPAGGTAANGQPVAAAATAQAAPKPIQARPAKPAAKMPKRARRAAKAR